jgi:hypothetical protein
MRLFQNFKDGLALRRLRRRLPYAYRRFVRTIKGERTETDHEYLERLRGIHAERLGQSRQHSDDEAKTRGVAVTEPTPPPRRLDQC